MDRYNHLFAFFYAVLKEVSEDDFSSFKELLKELKVDEDDIKKIKIKDEALLDVIKDIGYSKRIRQRLLEFEPPEIVQDYIEKNLLEAKKKAKEHFRQLDPQPGEVLVKQRNDSSFEIAVNRRLFTKDPRILKDSEDVYKIEFSCYYRKENETLEVSLSVTFKVDEHEIANFSASEVAIFDGIAECLGFSCAPTNKCGHFDAIVSEGETHYDNTCHLRWDKKIKYQDIK